MAFLLPLFSLASIPHLAVVLIESTGYDKKYRHQSNIHNSCNYFPCLCNSSWRFSFDYLDMIARLSIRAKVIPACLAKTIRARLPFLGAYRFVLGLYNFRQS
jgi:hypothetical protein